MIFPKKMPSRQLYGRVLCLLGALLLFILTGTVSAQPKQGTGQHRPRMSEPSRQKFRLDKTIFVTADFEHHNTAADFAQWLRSEGAAASNAYNKARSRITFQRVSSIAGNAGNDAWHMVIKGSRLTVTFTSENALQHAIATLQGMVTQEAGIGKYIPGGTYADWGARTAARDHGATADAATTLRPTTELEMTFQRIGNRSREIYVVLVDTDHWRMASPSLELAGAGRRLYPADGYYTTEQLQQLAAAAKRNHIDLIPTLELLSDNRAFTAAFGHSVFSVEGMRLVRAALEDCIAAMHPTKICLGSISSQADMRYMEFISDLASMLGVELVIIES